MTDNERAAGETPKREPESESESGSEPDHATDSGSDSEAVGDAERADPPEELVERVAEDDPEGVAREIQSLRERAADLEERVETAEELESKLKRKQAEFQNYKRRMDERREQERKRATEDLIERLVDVRDNLERGLEQDGDIREGVKSTLRQFDEVLAEENVETITPNPGEDVDPQRHEVLMRVESDHPSDTVADVHRPGYEMAGKVIRPAQVTVSDEG